MKHISHRASALLPGLACLLFCAAGSAQVMQQPGTFPHHRQLAGAQNLPESVAPAPAASPAGNAPAQPAVAPPAPAANLAAPPSLLDKPAQPAKVDLDAGHLVVQANNSSLSEILHQVSTESGMTIDGLNHDERVFGTYGPGNPHDVLSALLDGSGYNVVMFGETATGAPRQLTLSLRGAGASAPNMASRPLPQSNQDDDTDEEVQPVQNPEPPVQPIAPPPTPQGQGPTSIRTPQQMLQELQQIRQQQDQQQQQPPQQQP